MSLRGIGRPSWRLWSRPCFMFIINVDGFLDGASFPGLLCKRVFLGRCLWVSGRLFVLLLISSFCGGGRVFFAWKLFDTHFWD